MWKQIFILVGLFLLAGAADAAGHQAIYWPDVASITFDATSIAQGRFFEKRPAFEHVNPTMHLGSYRFWTAECEPHPDYITYPWGCRLSGTPRGYKITYVSIKCECFSDGRIMDVNDPKCTLITKDSCVLYYSMEKHPVPIESVPRVSMKKASHDGPRVGAIYRSPAPDSVLFLHSGTGCIVNGTIVIQFIKDTPDDHRWVVRGIHGSITGDCVLAQESGFRPDSP